MLDFFDAATGKSEFSTCPCSPGINGTLWCAEALPSPALASSSHLALLHSARVPPAGLAVDPTTFFYFFRRVHSGT